MAAITQPRWGVFGQPYGDFTGKAQFVPPVVERRVVLVPFDRRKFLVPLDKRTFIPRREF